MNEIERFKELVENSDNIVFFGGAGVSTESGIPDFRSVDGLYNQKYDYPPETILSHSFYLYHTEEFYRFYRDKMLALDAEPNMTHKKLAELEQKGKLKAVITQNIDGLHQKAGSGTWKRWTGSSCSLLYGIPRNTGLCSIWLWNPLPLRNVQTEDQRWFSG